MQAAKAANRLARILLDARPSTSAAPRAVRASQRSTAACLSCQLEARRFQSQVASEGDAQAYRERFDIKVRSDDVPAPWETFDQANWPSSISDLLREAQFPSPSPIQAQAWPIASAGRDCVAVSATGSGKTLGYLLPLIKKAQEEWEPVTRTSGPVAMIIAPTRELAEQIKGEVDTFGRRARVRGAIAVGGANRAQQARDLSAGPSVVVGTPGRLIDMLEAGYTTVQNVSYLVLDEADLMLDMGFEPQIQRILHAMPEHQTLLFSATWPRAVEDIARNYMKDYAHITVGSTDLAANTMITQHVEVLDRTQKRKRLVQLLEELSGTQNKVLIFVTTKNGADMLSDFLHADGWPVFAMHGDKSQDHRSRVLKDFREGRQLVMIATDVAARGLDVKDITCVVNYDMPKEIDTYVHRIGRTARAGRSGTSYSFVTEEHDDKLIPELIKILEQAKQTVPPVIQEMAESISQSRFYGSRGGGRGGSDRQFRRGGSGQFAGSFGGDRAGRREGVFGDRRGGGFGSRDRDSGGRGQDFGERGGRGFGDRGGRGFERRYREPAPPPSFGRKSLGGF